MAQDIDILDVYKFKEIRDKRAMLGSRVPVGFRDNTYWKGGDMIERIEYAKA